MLIFWCEKSILNNNSFLNWVLLSLKKIQDYSYFYLFVKLRIMMYKFFNSIEKSIKLQIQHNFAYFTFYASKSTKIVYLIEKYKIFEKHLHFLILRKLFERLLFRRRIQIIYFINWSKHVLNWIHYNKYYRWIQKHDHMLLFTQINIQFSL